MRTLVHISDLHFGRVNPELLAPLRTAIEAIAPTVLVVSGDLTQRARNNEFADAAAYLKTLPTPQIVVPGNHDVPFYDVIRRFLAPLNRFHRTITSDAFPFYRDDEIAVIGLNSARSSTFKGGRINEEQVAEAKRRFEGLPESVTRVVVTHHPFDIPAGGDENDVVGRSQMAMDVLAQCSTDVFLSGHLHRSNASSTASRYHIAGFAAVVIQAGTATSTRGRGEENSFNVIRIGETDLVLETWRWQSAHGAFANESEQRFRYTHGVGWGAVEA